jgi:hypothetical protein
MSTLEHDPIDLSDEVPLELAAAAAVPLPSAMDDESLLGLPAEELTVRPDPALRRLAVIAAAGVVLLGLAGLARVALDRAVTLPPGVVEPMSAQVADGGLRLDTSIARYESQRARMGR